MTPGLVTVFEACRAFGLTRAERLEWASVVLNCNVETFNQLGPADVARLVDAANGAVYMCKIDMDRRTARRLLRSLT